MHPEVVARALGKTLASNIALDPGQGSDELIRDLEIRYSTHEDIAPQKVLIQTKGTTDNILRKSLDAARPKGEPNQGTATWYRDLLGHNTALREPTTRRAFTTYFQIALSNLAFEGAFPAEQPKDLKNESGIAAAFRRIGDRWELGINSVQVLMGYKNAEPPSEALLRLGIGQTQDLLDRIGYLLAISLGLGTMFEEDVSKERTWLRSSNNSLGGKNPIDVMLEGHMSGLIAVAEAVRHERGV